MSRATLARRRAAEKAARKQPTPCPCEGRGYVPVRLVPSDGYSTGGGAMECWCPRAADPRECREGGTT